MGDPGHVFKRAAAPEKHALQLRLPIQDKDLPAAKAARGELAF